MRGGYRLQGGKGGEAATLDSRPLAAAYSVITSQQALSHCPCPDLGGLDARARRNGEHSVGVARTTLQREHVSTQVRGLDFRIKRMDYVTKKQLDEMDEYTENSALETQQSFSASRSTPQ